MLHVDTIKGWLTVTPDDDDNLQINSKDIFANGLFCNGAGDIKFLDGLGSTITLTVLAGVFYPFTITKVFDTDTDATGIHVGVERVS